MNSKVTKRTVILLLIILLSLFIIVPITKTLLQNNEQEAFESKVESLIRIYESFNNEKEGINRVNVTDDIFKKEDIDFINGVIMSMNENSTEVFNISDGKYCASGKLGKLVITKGECKTTEIEEVITKSLILTVNPNGGTWNNLSEIKNINLLTGEMYYLTNAEKYDDEFKEWNLNISGKKNNGKNFLTLTANAIYGDNNKNGINDKDSVEFDDVFESISDEIDVQNIIFYIDPNEGYWNGTNNESTITVNKNTSITIENPIKEGYTFKGWKLKVEANSEKNNSSNIEIKLIADYEINSYSLKVFYDDEGKTKTVEAKIKYGQKYNLAIPNREGYVFKGWKIDNKASKIIDNNKTLIMGNLDTKITAVWGKILKLNVNLNGGKATQAIPREIISGEKTTIEDPIQEGYVFYGWKVEGKNSKIENKIFTMGDNDTTLIALWSKPKNILTIDPNNGEKEYTKNLEPKEKHRVNTPSKLGYVLSGWKLQGDYSTIDNNIFTMGIENSKITAKWNLKDYKISYVIDGIVSKKYTTYNIESKTFTLYHPEKEGYIFVGWTYDNIEDPILNVEISKGTTGDKKYTAHFEKKEYKLFFDSQGGEFVNSTGYDFQDSLLVKYVKHDDKYGKLPEVKKVGYILKGWYDQKNNGKIVTSDSVIKANNITVYAQWDIEEYTIKFNTNGADEIKPKSYTIETETFALPNPTKFGYNFAGWYTDSEMITERIDKIEKGSHEDKELYAKWEAIEYNINYNLEGGTENKNTITKYTIETNEILFEVARKTGYNFLGWYQNIDNSCVSMQKIPKGATGDITLNAKWEEAKSYDNVKMYDMIASTSIADNKSSMFVENEKGIQFAKKSGLINGYGVYTTTESLNDTYPVHYYRGDIINNNVIFDDYCWKIIRTTSTGGTKLIYNGLPVNGVCNNSGNSSQTTKVRFNVGGNISGISYMTGTGSALSNKNYANFADGMKFGKSVEYVNGQYVLKDVYVKDEKFIGNITEILGEHHYTCFSTSDTCATINYIYHIKTQEGRLYFTTMTNNNNINNIVEKGILNSENKSDSSVKAKVDSWYKTSLLDSGKYIEDTIYCNDRSAKSIAGWDDKASIVEPLYFGGYYRNITSHNPSNICPDKHDSFTTNTENGNGNLIYPIGLLTLDEAIFAGYVWYKNSCNNYLYTGNILWTMTPNFISANNSYVYVLYEMLDSVHVAYTSGRAAGVRPVISLKNDVTIKSGLGTPENPFTINN